MNSLGLTIPLTIVSLLGLLVNGYIIVVVILTRQTGTANNLLLLHLGALNTLLGILFLVFTSPDLSKSGWLTQGAPCAVHGFLFTLLHPLVLWTICGLNCDRYYAIAAPLHYGHLVNPRKVMVGLGAGWVVALILCFPPFFAVAPYTFSPGLGSCIPNFALGPGALWYSAIYTAITLLLPATLIICCNLKILMIARYHRHRIASAIYEVTLSAQVTITHQRNPFFVPTVTAPSAGGPKFRGKSAVTTVLQLVVSFLILYVPYYSLILWDASLSTLRYKNNTITEIDHHVFMLASVLLTCSVPVNGFLYGLKNKLLRKTFQNYWRKKLSKNEVNQEIQARTPSTCGSRRPSLTPLGFFSKPILSRRLSEALLDVHRSPQRQNLKRIPSELSWRPNSTPGLNLSPTGEKCYKKRIPHTASCNTLQVPKTDLDEICAITDDEILSKIIKKQNEEKINRSSLNSANFFLQKVFGIELSDHVSKKALAIQTVLNSSPKRSPRILITRAFSEESDKTSVADSPAREGISRKLSSSTTLLEKKWRHMTFHRDDESDSENQISATTKPLLSSTDRDSSTSNRSSESSDTSEIYTGSRIYMALESNQVLSQLGETGSEGSTTEDQLLLSWPEHKVYDDKKGLHKKKSNLLKQSLINVQPEEIVL